MKIKNKEELGRRLLMERCGKLLSRREVREKTFLSEAAIRRIENAGNYTIDTLFIYTKFLGLEINLI